MYLISEFPHGLGLLCRVVDRVSANDDFCVFIGDEHYEMIDKWT